MRLARLLVIAMLAPACREWPVVGLLNRGMPDGGTATDGGQSRLNVLFIGNSYTYVNDLPGMFTQLAPAITTDEVVQGGATLRVHWENGIAQARIKQGGWTHVVLQGQSQEPLPELGGTPDFLTYAQMFGDLIIDAGALPVFFDTWARAAGDPSSYPPPDAPWTGTFLNPDQMQDELTESYAAAAKAESRSVLACAGEAFRRSLAQDAGIGLQQSDFSHPTVAGTYLAAGTLYVALTGKPVPAQSAVPAGLSPQDAARLRDTALVGSGCADVHLRALVSLRAENEFVAPGFDGGPPFDYGTAGFSIPAIYYLSNIGEDDAGLSDGWTLAPPFAWAGDGGFPGGSGTAGVGGTPFCSASLAPHQSCALSVSYSGTSSGAGRLTVGLSNAYIPSVWRGMQGTSTGRALLTVGAEPGYFNCLGSPCNGVGFFAGPGQQLIFSLLVTNRGALPVTALSNNAPLTAPFVWGDGGAFNAFPGGTGTGNLWTDTYPYCAVGNLGPGQRCLLTASFVMPDAGGISTPVDLAYSDSLGPVTPDALIQVTGFIPLPEL